MWSEITPLNFTKTVTKPKKADIRIRFVPHMREHEDPSKTILGQAKYPNSKGSDVEFNDEIHWTANSNEGKNLLQTACHEFGHALGLDHSDVPTALMFPTYQDDLPTDFTLDKDDIQRIQALYGVRLHDPKQNSLELESTNSSAELPQPTNNFKQVLEPPHPGTHCLDPISSSPFYMTYCWEGNDVIAMYYDTYTSSWRPLSKLYNYDE